MTIILFLIDTSASMNQRAYLGGRHTLLDVAKGAVETFIKFRLRDPASRGDRYMLLTCEEPPANIKAGWKENHATFQNELKNLQASGMTTLGAALKNAFDVLNINRMQTRIDTYGQGRSPFYLEPSVIVVITDGGRLSSPMGVSNDLNLPMHSPIPGSELTKEPFRWDQRLFSLVLRLAGTPAVERDPAAMVPSDVSPIDAMCEVTGGRSYCVSSQRMLMQCLESLVLKVQSGVVIQFEKVGADPPPMPLDGRSSESGGSDSDGGLKIDESTEKKNDPAMLIMSNQNGAVSRPLTPTMPTQNNNNNSWHSCRKLIYVHRSAQKGYSVGHWPIPEAFWPDVNTPALPPRSAHPIVKFTCQNYEPMVIDNFPFDKYELEPSPLTQFILSRKQPTMCWQVFVSNSHKNSESGHPFGYLKASTNLACVNLFVMPYNYPVLLPLLDDLFKVHRSKPTKEWRQQFDNYLKNMPLYYAGPLKRALQRMGVHNLVPESMENYLSYSVLNYLKKLQNQAKVEYERLNSSVGTGKPQGPEGIRVIPRSDPRKDMNFVSNPSLSERFSSLKEQIVDFNGFMLGIREKDVKTQSYRNPFDIPRKILLDQIARMRSNFLQTSSAQTRLQDEDQLHNMPVSQMGNYQEYLKKTAAPLREIESQPVRQHMFGNPFKIDKRMMVDEADIDLMGGASPTRGSKRAAVESPPGSPRPHKRKPGPLPRDLPIRRPVTPPVIASVPNLPPPEIPPPPSLTLIADIKSNSLDELPAEIVQLNGADLRVPMQTCISTVTKDVVIDLESNHLNEAEKPSIVELTNHIGEDSVKQQLLLNTELVNNIHDRLDTSVVVAVAPSVTVAVPAASTSAVVLHNNIDSVNLAAIKSENAKIKRIVFKEIRKPGRNFTALFENLRLTQGNLETRVSFVKDVIYEASRFKRKFLINLLTNYEQTLTETTASPSTAHSPPPPQTTPTPSKTFPHVLHPRP